VAGTTVAADPGTPVVSGDELGLPSTRSYSFDEIGEVARGAQLDFDALGRIVVFRAGACVVLNDTTWLEIADRSPGAPQMEYVALDGANDGFYGALGAWGLVRMENGLLRPVALAPASAPKWVETANFSQAVPLADGVCFVSMSGFVYWERATGRQSFHEIDGVSSAFRLGESLYLSTHAHDLYRFDPAQRTVSSLPRPTIPGEVIDQVTAFDATQVLLSGSDGRLALFDGVRFTPFPGLLGRQPLGRITAMCRLTEGNFAVAISGAGVYLAATDGRILTSLTTPEYHRVTEMAARENGVLWIVTENGVEKILYNSALTSFGQRQGLPLSWPQLVRWRGRIVVASGGRLYEAITGPRGDTTRFQLMPGQPEAAIWGLATDGSDLLIGTNQGVSVRTETGGFELVVPGIDVGRIAGVGDTFLVLGAREIAAVRRVDGRWTEAAPRVPGVGYPFIAHATARAAWLELGPGRVARAALRGDRLHVQLLDRFPWPESRWINVGWIGDTVTLSNVPGGRLYFDERTETFVERPELNRLLDAAPYPVLRVRQDGTGTIWAMHERGVFTIREFDGRPVFDTATYGVSDVRFPVGLILPDDDVWLLGGQSLHHVNRQFATSARSPYQPVLVSLIDGRSGRELLERPGAPAAPATFTHEQNSLVLRFFAGSYAGRQPPAYEYHLTRDGERHIAVGTRSLLALTDLREGRYRLDVRLTSANTTLGPPLAIDFRIEPPWFRTWYAYAGYGAALAAILYGLLRWGTHRARSQTVALEQLVAARTNELRDAMQRLNDEARQSATLAERNRLAGEIHDSVQQGLSGLMLQLDATLKLADLPPGVRDRLHIARNMVSFTRHEVQHAVWDMESPILEGTELGEALRKIAALIEPGPAQMEVLVRGTPVDLPSAVKHHLLRIGQEAMTNAVRHAAARTITITVAYEPAGVTLRVADDGNGFVPQAVLSGGFGQFGLRGLRGRAEKIGGHLQIQSTPGQGTTVSVSVATAVPVL
jgi:signal transduction histidine kinase